MMHFFNNTGSCDSEKILELIKEVLILSHDKFLNTIEENYKTVILKEEKEYIQLNIDVVKLIISIVEKRLKRFRLHFNKVVVDLNKMDIPNKIKLEFVNSFLNILEEHAKQESCDDSIYTYTKRLRIVASTFLNNNRENYGVVFNNTQQHKEEKEDIKIDEDENTTFMDFESFDDSNTATEEQKDNIEILSKKNINKLSAAKWIKRYEIETEEIDDISEALDNFYTVSDMEQELSEQYFEVSLNTLDTFAKFFDQTIEFMELSSVVQNMMNIIESAYNSIDEDKKPLLKMFIEGMVDDLNKWVKEVLNEQTAVDIHYLDASIYSSIAQIEMIFEQKNENQEDEDEEIELF